MQEKLSPPLPRPTESYTGFDRPFRFLFRFVEYFWGMADFRNKVIKVLEEVDEDIENWHPDQESDKSEEILGDKEDEECEKDREFHIGWDDSRIEVVGLYCMDEDEHSDDWEDNIPPPIVISDNEDRDSREECPENWNESENKDDDSECDDIGECCAPMKETDNYQRGNREERIDKSDKCLCLENKPESFSDFAEDNTVFLINKRKIPFLYRFEIGGDLGSIDEEDITEDHGDEKLGEENPDIFDILKSPADDIFDGSWIKKPAERFIDPEIDIEGVLEIGDRVLYLIGNHRRIMDESFSLVEEVGNERIEEGYDDHDETYVDDGNDSRKRWKSSEEFLGKSMFEMSGELPEFVMDGFTHIEEEVREEECDEENHQKRFKEINQECEKENSE